MIMIYACFAAIYHFTTSIDFAGEFVDLAARLAALEKMSDGAPLLCVVDGRMPASPYEAAGDEPPQGQTAASGENWELL